MNWKTKNETVERMKKNERAYCFLSKDERLALVGCDCRTLQTTTTAGAIKYGPIYDFKESFEYEHAVVVVDKNYTLPIEPPEGYRLVTDEEREKYSMPDCWMQCDLAADSVWRNTTAGFGWGDVRKETGYVAKAFGGLQFVFAVPLTFTFEPEETISIDGEDYTLSQIKNALKNAKEA